MTRIYWGKEKLPGTFLSKKELYLQNQKYIQDFYTQVWTKPSWMGVQPSVLYCSLILQILMYLLSSSELGADSGIQSELGRTVLFVALLCSSDLPPAWTVAWHRAHWAPGWNSRGHRSTQTPINEPVFPIRHQLYGSAPNTLRLDSITAVKTIHKDNKYCAMHCVWTHQIYL